MDDLATNEEALLALLRHNTSLGNGKARELLGWDEATYAQVKESLVAKGQVVLGRGRGGSISLVAEGQEALNCRRLLSPLLPYAQEQPLASACAA